MTIKKGFERITASIKEIPRIHYREGLESGFMDDYESAIESFDRVNYITIGSSFFTNQSQYFKANAYAQLEQYDKAVKEYKKFLENNQQNTKGWNNLGAADCDLEKYDDALPCFDNATQVHPNPKQQHQHMQYIISQTT